MTTPLAEARAILGPEAAGRSDQEIARLVEIADLLAEWAIEKVEMDERERGAA